MRRQLTRADGFLQWFHPIPGACIVVAVRCLRELAMASKENGLHDRYLEDTFFDLQYADAGTTYAQQSFFNEACGVIPILIKKIISNR